MASVKAPAFRPSRAFQAEFEKAKKGGINDKEYGKLTDLVTTEISKSSKPQALAALYTAEFKGWQAKGLTTKDVSSTAESAGWVFKSVADTKSITDAVKMFKAKGAELAKQYPDLKDIDFKKTKISDFGDSAYLAIFDKKGKELTDNDPRIATFRKILGSPFKDVGIGGWDQ